MSCWEDRAVPSSDGKKERLMSIPGTAANTLFKKSDPLFVKGEGAIAGGCRHVRVSDGRRDLDVWIDFVPITGAC